MSIWLTDAEVMALPNTGAAFDKVKKAADALQPGAALVSDQNSNHDVNTLAAALMAVRLKSETYGSKAGGALQDAIGTEKGGRALALARNLPSYVIAADLIGYRTAGFVKWVSDVRTAPMTNGPATLIKSTEERPNNWGTHAQCARIAADLYLGDTVDLQKTIKILKGWLGDRTSYSGFKYGDTAWQADPLKPVGINLKGTTKQGHSVDGVLPDDQRRAGGFTWPPPKENYVWEALQGTTVACVLLYRNGFPDVIEWSNRALLRAYRWLYDVCMFPATGDDAFQPWLANYLYGAGTLPTTAAGVGKNMAWTDWTHAKPGATPPPVEPPPTTDPCAAQRQKVTEAEAALAAAKKALADCEA